MQSRLLFALFLLFGSFSILPLSSTQAVAEDNNGTFVDGAGFTLYGTESIKGSGSDKVEHDPVCDRSKRPKIFKVEPDEAKPGQKVKISGENFGTKECFHGVAFSAAGPTKIDYTFVNDATIEATVPDVKAGMSFIDVVAGGGNARSKGFLVQAK
ncbi:MAG: IPT/TIG domain-containing protein [Nitrospira sp.]|nr:MAG: IPT/TIG domain-containing protein [Nitrospira sp.]